jgi:hypothetical protein
MPDAGRKLVAALYQLYQAQEGLQLSLSRPADIVHGGTQDRRASVNGAQGYFDIFLASYFVRTPLADAVTPCLHPNGDRPVDAEHGTPVYEAFRS